MLLVFGYRDPSLLELRRRLCTGVAAGCFGTWARFTRGMACCWRTRHFGILPRRRAHRPARPTLLGPEQGVARFRCASRWRGRGAAERGRPLLDQKWDRIGDRAGADLHCSGQAILDKIEDAG